MSDYDTEFTEDSRQLLKAYNLYNRTMVRDDSVRPTSETIEWTQISRCWWGCEEEYLLVDYYQDGDKSNPVMKVYVAKSELSPPSEFWTSGYNGYLHFGFLYYGGPSLSSIQTVGDLISTDSKLIPLHSSSILALEN